MAAAGDACKADCPGQAICDEGHPTFRAIAVSDDRGNGNCRHGMDRIKPARMKRIVSAVEETIRIRAVAAVLQGLLSAGDSLEGQIERKTIRECFGGKERAVLRIGIFFYQADRVDRRGNRRDECSRVHSAERPIKTAESVCRAERRSSVRVGSDERGCDAHDCDGGKPVFTFGELSWKEPNFPLIAEEIRGKCAKRYLAIRGSNGGRLLLRR